MARARNLRRFAPLLLAGSWSLHAQDISPVPLHPLSAAEIAEAQNASLSPPAPAEWLRLLGATCQPRWRQFYRPPATGLPASRPAAALALGTVTADLWLATEARDPQQIRNLLQDADALERVLGTETAMNGPLERLSLLAEAGAWDALRTETEAVLAAESQALHDQRDAALSPLLHLGAWLRTIQIDAAVQLAHPKKAPGLALLQPDLVPWLQEQLAAAAPALDDKLNDALSRLLERFAVWAELEGPLPGRRLDDVDPLLTPLLNRLRLS